MGCATKTLKYIHITANVIFAIFALIAIIVVATAMIVEKNSHSTPLLIVVCLLFLIAFVGCFGALRESVWLSWEYTVSMSIITLALAYVVFFLLMPYNPVEVARTDTDKNWQLLLKGNPAEMIEKQTQLKCCGKDNAQDYIRANMTIPLSCYHNENDHKKILNEDGCYKAMAISYATGKKVLLYMFCALLVLQIAGVALGAFLAIHFTNNQRHARY